MIKEIIKRIIKITMIIMAIEIGKIIKVRIEENYKSNNSYYDNGNSGITITGIGKLQVLVGERSDKKIITMRYK